MAKFVAEGRGGEVSRMASCWMNFKITNHGKWDISCVIVTALLRAKAVSLAA